MNKTFIEIGEKCIAFLHVFFFNLTWFMSAKMEFGYRFLARFLRTRVCFLVIIFSLLKNSSAALAGQVGYRSVALAKEVVNLNQLLKRKNVGTAHFKRISII